MPASFPLRVVQFPPIEISAELVEFVWYFHAAVQRGRVLRVSDLQGKKDNHGHLSLVWYQLSDVPIQL